MCTETSGLAIQLGLTNGEQMGGTPREMHLPNYRSIYMTPNGMLA
jgi:hypothetical protein